MSASIMIYQPTVNRGTQHEIEVGVQIPHPICVGIKFPTPRTTRRQTPGDGAGC